MIFSSKNISLVSLVISERELQEINIKIENYFNGRRQIAIAFGNKLMFNILRTLSIKLKINQDLVTY